MLDEETAEQALRELEQLHRWVEQQRQDLTVVGELSWAAYYLRANPGPAERRLNGAE